MPAQIFQLLQSVCSRVKSKVFSIFLKTKPESVIQNIVHEKPKIEVTEVMQAKKSKTLSLDDPEHKEVIIEILDLYGYPVSSGSCMNKQEKIMYIFGAMAVYQGLRRDKSLTGKLVENKEDSRIESYCREYYEKYGYHIIPTDKEVATTDAYNVLKIGLTDKDDSKNSKLELPRSEEED